MAQIKVSNMSVLLTADVFSIDYNVQSHIYEGRYHSPITNSRQSCFAFSEHGPWYHSNDYKICEKCQGVVLRFNSWKDHGHGEIYGTPCKERVL